MKKILKIDYTESLQSYNAQLLSKLRDFGEKNLQLWVPDDNIILSILNMVFSVNQNGIEAMSILINKKDLSSKNLVILKKILLKLSSLEVLENMENLTLNIGKIQNSILEQTISIYIKENQNIHSTSAARLNKKKKINVIKDINNQNLDQKIKKIKDLYSLEVINKKFNNYISADIFKNNSEKSDYFSAQKENIKIILKVTNNLISDAKYNCDSNDFDKYYLDKFCSLVHNLPIQEAYEHGVMKLEYFSRSTNLEKEIKGILSPIITKNIFYKIQILMRDLWLLYSTKKKIKISKNLFDTAPSKKWINLDKNKKIDTIKKILDNFQKENNIDQLLFDELNDDNIRLTLNFRDDNMSSNTDKSVILLKFEKYIRNKMERRIEIFYKELKDANKLREKNTPI